MSTIARDIRLSVIAEVSQYAKEMAKIPGMTDKQAAAAAKSLSTQLGRAQAQAAMQAQKAAQQGATSWRDSFADIGKIAAGMLTADAIKGAITAVSGLKDELATYRLAVDRAAIATSLSHETIAGLAAAAKASDSDLSTMVTALKRLPSSMADAAAGTGKAAAAFRELGVRADIDGVLRPADDVLRDLLGSLKAVEDPGRRAALAADALGKSSFELLAVLDDPAALDAWVERTREYGVDVGPAAIQSAKDWKAAKVELQTVIKGVVADLADQVDATTKLEAVTLGLVYTIELTREMYERLDLAMYTHDDAATELARSLRRAELAELGVGGAALASTRAFYEQRRALAEAGKETKVVAEATDDHAESERERAERLRASAKAAEEARRAYEQYLGLYGQLLDIADRAGEDLFTAEQKIRIERGKALQQIAEMESAALRLAQTEADAADIRIAAEMARVEVTESHERRLDALREELAAKETARAEKARQDELDAWVAINQTRSRAHADEMQRIAAERAARQQAAQFAIGVAGSMFDSLGDLAGSYAEGVAQGIQDEDKARRAAAMGRYVAERAQALASIALSAVSAAMAWSAQVPPPAIPGMIALAAGMGALQAAAAMAVSPPAFHSGRTPDELDARLLRSEGVASPAAMARPGFRDSLQRANEGLPDSGGGTATMQLLLNDRAVDTIVSRAVRRGRRTGRELEARRVQGVGRGSYR